MTKRAPARWFCCRMRPIWRFTCVASSCFFERVMRPARRCSAASMRWLNLSCIARSLLRRSAGAAQDHRLAGLRIAGEAGLDGIYVIRTSVAAAGLDAPTTVRAYKGLSHAERAFRSLKTVDLKIRPIHHWLEDRVRAHVFLCMLAYYVEWHMRERLKPILFDDDQLDQVKPARRSRPRNPPPAPRPSAPPRSPPKACPSTASRPCCAISLPAPSIRPPSPSPSRSPPTSSPARHQSS